MADVKESPSRQDEEEEEEEEVEGTATGEVRSVSPTLETPPPLSGSPHPLSWLT